MVVEHHDREILQEKTQLVQPEKLTILESGVDLRRALPSARYRYTRCYHSKPSYTFCTMQTETFNMAELCARRESRRGRVEVEGIVVLAAYGIELAQFCINDPGSNQSRMEWKKKDVQRFRKMSMEYANRTGSAVPCDPSAPRSALRPRRTVELKLTHHPCCATVWAFREQCVSWVQRRHLAVAVKLS
jgi:hypothetical protein